MQWKQTSKHNLLFEKNVNLGNSILTICVEKLESNCLYINLTEFMFKVNDSTHKDKVNLFYSDMYKLFRLVHSSLEEYINDYVIKNIKNNIVYKIEFEADGVDNKEKKYKNNCYEFYLKRICEKFSSDNILCSYSKSGNLHYLTFIEQ